jgi:hypothetical protein
MGKFDDFNEQILSPQGKRLLKEWMEIDKLCHLNKHIAYIVRRRNGERLPVEYEIIYNIRSITSVTEPKLVKVMENGFEIVRELREPVYGQEHRMRITLPNNFPSARGNPQLNFITQIWHPNIRHVGKFQGRVCSNEKDLGITTNLATRIVRIGQYLQYQLYHALDTYPYPEDTVVAEWVRNEAEPMGWVSLSKGIFTDFSNLKEKEKKPRVIVLPKENVLKAGGKNFLKI